MVKQRVAVIGLGISGIQALKTCVKDPEIDPVAFEREDDLGGFWRFSPDPARPSVYKSTHIDTGRDLNSYGDRPFMPDDDIIVHNSKLVQYLRDNFREFGLRDYVRFRCAVDWIEPIENTPRHPSKKVRWRVYSTQSVGDSSQSPRKRVEEFDGVMICTGRHSRPWLPHFEGLEKFKGPWMHSSSYKSPDAHSLTNKRVCVVGIGNSGADITTELAQRNKQVYLVARHGVWAIDCGGIEGFRGKKHNLAAFLAGGGNRLAQTRVNAQDWRRRSDDLEGRFDPKHIELLKQHNLKPDHRILAAHPTGTGIADPDNTLYTELEKGHITAKRGIRRITEKGIVFVDSDGEVELDAIVFATGYRQAVDFLDPKVVDMRYRREGDNKVKLYRNMFPMGEPSLKYTSLAFISFVQSATFMCADLHSQYYVRVLRGINQLPSQAEMIAHHDSVSSKLSKQFYKSNRHHIQEGLELRYYDDIAKDIGCFPYPEVLLRERPESVWSAWFTPWNAVQYRLVGPNKVDEAEEWIRKCYETTTLRKAPENWRDGRFWAEKIRKSLADYNLIGSHWAPPASQKSRL